MRSRHGFSLIELIIVVAVIGLVLMISTSSLLSLQRQSQVRSGIDRYVSKHALARATAIRTGRTAQLRADTVQQAIWVQVDTKVVGDVTYFRDGLRFRAKRSILCFDPRGLATGPTMISGGVYCESPADTVVFRHASRSDTVRTTLLGRIMR